jgi:DNA-binding NarL/FixJ family response regulator
MSYEARLRKGFDALRAGDGAAARTEFDDALAEHITAAALEGAGKAAYLQHDYRRAVEIWERAYAAYRASAEHHGAVRIARMLAFMNGMVIGDLAVMQGWLARAKSLLSETTETLENGWVALVNGMFEDDPIKKIVHLREALDVAERFADSELRTSALAYLGATLVHNDEVEEGMVLLDEACAAASGGEVDDFLSLQEIFCQCFAACEHAHDVTRADQWIRIGEDIATRRNLPTVSAFCRTHYGGLLTAAGRWEEADTALTEAIRLWNLGPTRLASGALVRLADLRVRQGRLEEAEQLLDGLHADADAAGPLAIVYLRRGDKAIAADILERTLAQIDPTSARAAPLWALLAEVRLERGEMDEAAAAVEHVDVVAQRHASDYLAALSALARGRLCLASGAGDPRECLRRALTGFAKARLPMELAQARLALAHAMTDEEPEVAVAEAKAALDAFERLQATRDADAAAALLRSLGGPARTGPKGSTGTLTRREGEVLELLGRGLSNPEISDRLFISRKTVEHHVSSVLSKLGLRSRAEAAAYATRAQTSAPR